MSWALAKSNFRVSGARARLIQPGRKFPCPSGEESSTRLGPPSLRQALFHLRQTRTSLRQDVLPSQTGISFPHWRLLPQTGTPSSSADRPPPHLGPADRDLFFLQTGTCSPRTGLPLLNCWPLLPPDRPGLPGTHSWPAPGAVVAVLLPQPERCNFAAVQEGLDARAPCRMNWARRWHGNFMGCPACRLSQHLRRSPLY